MDVELTAIGGEAVLEHLRQWAGAVMMLTGDVLLTPQAGAPSMLVAAQLLDELVEDGRAARVGTAYVVWSA